MIEFRLFFDTGLFMLIWLVQLIVYPAFLYYPKDDFLRWHKKYTRVLTFIVAPFLAGQVISVSYDLFNSLSSYPAAINSILILSVIGYTFVQFVPLHRQLQVNYSKKMIKHLIKHNWYRTALWTTIVIIDIIQIFEYHD